MFRKHCAVLALLSCFGASALADTSVLIVQHMVPEKNGADPNVAVSDYIAQELDTDGRINPIVYSMTDPVFRAAAESGRIKDVVDRPNLEAAFNIAHQLGTEFVLVEESYQSGKAIRSRAKLYKDHRQIWKDEQDLSVTSIATSDQDNTCRSIARTMILRMNAGPLKGYARRTKTMTPDLAKGQAPVVPVVPVAEVPVADPEQLKRKVNDLVAAGKTESAILLLRDSVDTLPLDLDRRVMLINVLLAGDPKAAAEEARRATTLMPDKPELRALSAKAWMAAGLPAETQKDLNEAVARDPGGTNTRLMLGELSLSQLEPEKAMDHLDQAIKQQDSSRSRFLRAVCRALLGNVDGMASDLNESTKLQPKLTPVEQTERTTLVADLLDRMFTRDGATVRLLTQQVVVKPHNRDLREQIASISKLLQARSALLGVMSPTAETKASHERRILAHRLLAQSLIDLQTFSDKGDEDALSDSRINLGEALKQMAAIKKK